MFITFEGGEGSGKTTLIVQLRDVLIQQGHAVLVSREPGGTQLGEAIRGWLLKSEYDGLIGNMAELLLFLAARAQHLKQVIRPALEHGKIVLCDRFNDSSVVYQGIARKLGKEKVQALCAQACEGIEPDKTFLLDVVP